MAANREVQGGNDDQYDRVKLRSLSNPIAVPNNPMATAAMIPMAYSMLRDGGGSNPAPHGGLVF